MSKTEATNATLLSLGVFLAGVVPTLFQTNFWGAIVCAVLAVGVFAVREVLP
jgi:hypothetical protein